MNISHELVVIGGGLAGSEAAWQAAEQGIKVLLYEMRPFGQTGAHKSSCLAELICSNSLGSDLPDRASGILKAELRRMGSLLLRCAETVSLPAGGALAVDREQFSYLVTEAIEKHPRITILRQEIIRIPEGTTIIASGPLTSPGLCESLINLTGCDNLYFYDAIAPIVSFDSINMSVAFRASRYYRGKQDVGDYINCPMSHDQYEVFFEFLLNAEAIELREFEGQLKNGVTAGSRQFFEGCMPIEVIARRGKKALLFGPLRPVGLVNPHTGKRPYAVVQLRQDNLAGTLYNLVGFQTNLKTAEQKQIIRLIPGLEAGEIVRYGQMHRNTFIYSPALLNPTMQFRNRANLFFGGQITGVEGYVASIATGLLAGLNAARLLQAKPLLELPRETMIGALCYYITHAMPSDYQPMKANFGILPPIELQRRLNKRERAVAYANRSANVLDASIKCL